MESDTPNIPDRQQYQTYENGEIPFDGPEDLEEMLAILNEEMAEEIAEEQRKRKGNE